MNSSNIEKAKTSPLQESGKVKKTAKPKEKTGIPKKSSAVSTSKIKKASVKKKEVASKSPISKTTKRDVKFDKKITDKLKKIVSNYTEYPEMLDNIERDTTKNFIDELNIDSVDFVEIIVDVEQAFNITIKDEEIYQLKSFEDLYVAIEDKINATHK